MPCGGSTLYINHKIMWHTLPHVALNSADDMLDYATMTRLKRHKAQKIDVESLFTIAWQVE